MNAPEVSMLARRQLDDYDRRQPGTAFEDTSLELTVPDAFRVQIAIARLREQRGEEIAGYKVGCLGREVQEQLNADGPVFGHLFHCEMHPSGALLDSGNFVGLAIEGEYAVRLAHDIPDIETLQAEGPALLSHVFPVIELHNLFFRRPQPSAPELVANNAIHAGVVLPEREYELSSSHEISDHELVVFKNGEILGKAPSADPFADVLDNLGVLVKLLGGYGLHLRSGQIALTGTPLPLYPVSAGDAVEVDAGDLGSVKASVT